MIHHISIENFAIIKNSEIDFTDGLNIITGETGSGKSIVIEAISLVLGARADSSFIRTGTDRATIQLSGTINGEEVVITRELQKNGRNLCRLNGELVTLTMLSERCKGLADIHGQYDNQTLLDPESHIDIIDRFGGSDIINAKVRYASSWKNYQEADRTLANLMKEEASNAKKLDFYRYQIDEINRAQLIPGEDQELADRVSLLQNSEKIFQGGETAREMISGDTGALTGLGTAMNALEGISSYSTDIEEISEQVSDMFYNLQDTADSLRLLMDSLTFSPDELDTAIARIDLIDSLKKKYGKTIEDILTYAEQIEDELYQIENFDEEIERLRKEKNSALIALKNDADRLTELRKKSAEDFSAAVRNELLDLNFNRSLFETEFKIMDTPGSNGQDICQFLISTNAGEDLKPLARTASGGEISRIMLAIHNISSAKGSDRTMVFDEIDTGISGKTAAVVGRKLREISKAHQIVCITHLPQIAAMADTGFRIHKETDGKTTETFVDQLTEEQQVEEIARLLGGEDITETAKDNARELIHCSRK